MKKILLLATLALFILSTGKAQSIEWVEMMQDPEANLFTVQQSFNAYFATHPIEKGSGWKQFKRWEYFHSLRIDPQGNLRHPDSLYQALLAYEEGRNSGKRSTQPGPWTELGPVYLPANSTSQPNGMGRIACIAFHPSDFRILYAGTASGGLWRSNDHGNSWVKISSGLLRLGVSSILPHPTNSNILYMGTGDRDNGDAPGLGVWRSTDGGSSWHAHNNGMGNRTVYEILPHPNNSSILFASTYDRIYRSTNGGSNWNQVHSGHSCKDLAYHPTNPNIIYAAGTKLYRSLNGGLSFSQVSNGLPGNSIRMALAVSPAQPAQLNVLVAGSQGFAGLYKSTNSGASFSLKSSSPNILGADVNGGNGNQGWYDLVLIADPDTASVLYAGGINLWKSTNSGQSWQILTHWYGAASLPAVHADDHVLEWSPHTGDLYLGHDGGIHRSSNAGTTWADISSGLAVAQVYKIGLSATHSERVINGYQDNGTAVFYEGQWRTGIGGDGMESLYDYSDPDVVYGSLYHGEIRRSVNGGVTFLTVGKNGVNGINESGAWVTPFKLHPENPNSMFAGYKNLWRSDNIKTRYITDVSWTRISNFSSNSKVVDFAFAPSDPNVVYLSHWGNNKLYISTNALAASPTWTSLHNSLPANLPPKDIEIDPHNASRLWIALGNDIYESNNAGISWTNISGSLPNISLNTIAVDHRSATESIYVGMDVGVYYLDSTLNDWQSYDLGLPNVEITELEIYYDNDCERDILRAGTYGRGLWETDLKNPTQAPPLACFEASQTEVCEGMVVKFEDQSPIAPSNYLWQISPATYSFVNNTQANSANPEVVFHTGGNYSVSLVASNAYGQSSENKPDYIQVNGTAPLLPLIEDFEGVGTCATNSNCGGTICGLPNGWVNMGNGIDDDIDWRLNTGSTPSSLTGPSADANPGTSSGKYIYMEASGNCYGHAAKLMSPCIDLRSVGTADLIFSLHMYGSTMGSLAVDILHDGQWDNNVISPISGNLGNTWRTMSVNLNAYIGQVIRLRFRGMTGFGYYSDLALDNIQVTVGILDTEIAGIRGEHIPDNGNLLSWETSNNAVGETMLLQRQEPDGGYLTVTEMAVSEKEHYEFLDLNPWVGSNFYRLSIIDFDGNITYSDLVEVITPEEEEWARVYPNPFKEELWLEVVRNENQVIPVWIKDLQGKLIHQLSFHLNTRRAQFKIDMAELPSGMYIIELEGRAYKAIKK